MISRSAAPSIFWRGAANYCSKVFVTAGPGLCVCCGAVAQLRRGRAWAQAGARAQRQRQRLEFCFDPEHLPRTNQDTCVGMLFSNAIALCIVVATVVTLNLHGDTNHCDR
jgi:hypothetical protein